MSRRLFMAQLAAAGLLGGPAVATPTGHGPLTKAEAGMIGIGADALRLKLMAAESIGLVGRPGLLEPDMVRAMAFPGVDAETNDTIWTSFFSATQMFVGSTQSPTPVVGYYNAVLDMWWVTQWESSGSVRRVATAKWLSGDMLGSSQAGSGETILPLWLRNLTTSSLIEGLQAAGRAANRRFGEVFALQGSSRASAYDRLPADAPARNLLLERTFAILKGLSAFLHDEPARRAHDQLLLDLNNSPANPQPTGLSPEATETYRIIRHARGLSTRRLRPVAALSIKGSWFVVSSGPFSGRYMLLTAIPQASGGPRIARIALIDVFGRV